MLKVMHGRARIPCTMYMLALFVDIVMHVVTVVVGKFRDLHTNRGV
jgi:hypothetical protein